MSSLVTEVNARKSLNIYKRNDYFTIRITFVEQTETTNLNQFCGRFGEKEFQQVNFTQEIIPQGQVIIGKISTNCLFLKYEIITKATNKSYKDISLI